MEIPRFPGVIALKLIDIKFDEGDYMGDFTLHAKIQNDRPIGGVWAYGMNKRFQTKRAKYSNFCIIEITDAIMPTTKLCTVIKLSLIHISEPTRPY